MTSIKNLEKKIIISVQAMPDEPLYKAECMQAMMESVINGGAEVLRVAGVRDVKMAKALNTTVIGITKPNKLPENWLEVVYITPTLKDVDDLINAGADIIAFDGTSRIRPDGCTLIDIINKIHSANRLAMADISTFEEGINCANLGVDIISTTLAGYTSHSAKPTDKPDFDLLKKLVNATSTPVILEGRIWEKIDVKQAFELGAYCVVIGSAVTRPQLITKRFINYNI